MKKYRFDSLYFYCGEADSTTPPERTTPVAPPEQPWPDHHIPKYIPSEYRWEFVDMSPPVVPVEQPPVFPTVRLTSATLTPNDDNVLTEFFKELTVRVGTVVAYEAEIVDPAGNIIPVTDSFRLPLVSSDGRERITLASFVDGKATIPITFKESGVWSLTQEEINKRLPANIRFNFDGMTVYAYEN